MNRYRKGRAAEYKTMRRLEAEGRIALRTAGSHGVVDVVGIASSGVCFVSVKAGTAKPTRAEREALTQLAALVPSMSVELWTWKPRQADPVVEVF